MKKDRIAEGFLGLLEVFAGALGVFDAAVDGLAALAEDLGLQRFGDGRGRDAVLAS